MCIKFLSDLFKVPKSAIDIIGGKTGREKKIRLTIPNRGNMEAVVSRLREMIPSTKGKA